MSDSCMDGCYEINENNQSSGLAWFIVLLLNSRFCTNDFVHFRQTLHHFRVGHSGASILHKLLNSDAFGKLSPLIL